MTCRKRVPQSEEWRSTVMQAVTDAAERVTPVPAPHEWRSCTMRVLESVVTPGTAANVAVSLVVTAFVIPRIPSRAIAVVAGFAAGSILGR